MRTSARQVLSLEGVVAERPPGRELASAGGCARTVVRTRLARLSANVCRGFRMIGQTLGGGAHRNGDLLVQEIGDRFEETWQPGQELSAIDAFLPEDGRRRSMVLIELAARDLELRLLAGQTARVEQYLGRYRALEADGAALLELVRAEF